MKQFASLTQQKQTHILNAATTVFATYDYKKASMQDIAKAAGISKSMLFYYFKSKKQLYLFLLTQTTARLQQTVLNGLDPSITDFFDKLLHISSLKLQVASEQPFAFSFLNKAHFETDAEVHSDIAQFLSKQKQLGTAISLSNIDRQKFAPDVSPELVLNLLTKYVEGQTYALQSFCPESLQRVMEEFKQVISLFKAKFYK